MRYLKFISCLFMMLFVSATISSASFEARDSFHIHASTATDPLFFVNLLPGTAENETTRIATGENQSLALNYGRLPSSMIGVLPANDFPNTVVLQNKSTSSISVSVKVIATNTVGLSDLEDIYFIYRMNRMSMSNERTFVFSPDETIMISTFVYRGLLRVGAIPGITYPSGTYTGHLLITIDSTLDRRIPVTVTLP
ncbi:hypothetical protein FLK61_38130 [Paenalkalicoccus suaedae]|uniref:Uncharacterized protein n=1 Tax=Paenalkalicoccus suaedae TaxID=2592382 RepID=A0A859FI09_9BACI|nr:hypothetical protein [Paenalkalicoccus suaedae]QKS72450.1 hypothetical protein FLK61_38130 [Paenalkalicoccus suaedae]